jgi:spermidine/putrescine transport system ATP-binding protein
VAAPWLIAENLRIDDREAVAIESLSFASEGPHLVVIGGPSVLGHAFAGTAPVARGSVTIRGKTPHAALLAGEVAYASLDPRLPDSWSPRTFVQWSARLTGAPRRVARIAAGRALEALELGASATRPLSSLPLVARRAATLAAALATGATTVIIDDPLVGLADDAARTLARIAADAFDGVAWVYLAGRFSIGSAFGLRADDALVLGPQGAIAQGAPAEIAAKERLYAVRVLGSAHALADRVRARGATAEAKDRELRVELPAEMTTADLFALAAEASVTIISLRPVASSLT